MSNTESSGGDGGGTLPFGIFVGLVLCLVTALAVRKQPSRKEKRHAAGAHMRTDGEPTEPGHAPVLVKFAQEGWHADEKQHREREKRHWMISSTASIAGGIVATIAAVFACGAFYEAHRQADAAEESNRPWLMVKAVEIDKFVITSDAVGTSIEVTSINYGNAPALRVYGVGTIRRQNESLDNDDFMDEARTYCASITYPAQYLGAVGVPNQTMRTHAGAGRTIADLGATQPDMENGTSTLPSYIKQTGLHVVGCLLYEGTSRRIHHASFDFYIPDVDITQPISLRSVTPRGLNRDPVFAD